ncbi:MAG: hypothetical protein A2343_04470 [Candidatus Moranbacteria bacterium RIFOXYB12_FULL_35_8]|nr:MAG: hypothetical protein A2343_04470 [Candidatus Moranbacteria bacterium RIFOXYB12_FULL_35_8]
MKKLVIQILSLLRGGDICKSNSIKRYKNFKLMNIEEGERKGKKWWKYLLYFFCGWLFFFALACFLIIKGGYNLRAELKEDWIIVFFITIFPAIISILLIDFIIVKEKMFTNFYYYWIYFSAGLFLFSLWLYGAEDNLQALGIMAILMGLMISIVANISYKLIIGKKDLDDDEKSIWPNLNIPVFRKIINLLRRKNQRWDFKKIGAIFLIILVVIVVFLYQKIRIESAFFCSKESVNRAVKGVVLIEGSEGSGSGFFISPNMVLTNNHVVSFNKDLSISGYNGHTSDVRVVATDTVMDLAILEVKGIEGTKELGWRKNPIKQLDEVYAVGFPSGRKNISITRGIVSALTLDDFNSNQYIQMDAAINPGNSGGPLLDGCGKVVGINTSSLRNAQNIGFAIRANQIEARVAKMLEKSKLASREEIEKNYPSDQAEVVARYYDALGAGMLEEAYDFYSIDRKKKIPFENWKEGFDNTYFITLKKVELTPNENTVFASLLATDFGEEFYTFITKEFEGQWKLIREDGLWKLNESQIDEIQDN